MPNYTLDYEYEAGYACRVRQIGERRYRYDLNGNVTMEQDGPFTGTERAGTDIRDLGNGTYYVDSKTGRWLSTDPALGEYVPGAPVNDAAKKRNGNLPEPGRVFNYVFLILSLTLLFANCLRGKETIENEYKEKLNKELETLFWDNNNTVEKIKQYFHSKNIEYEFWENSKSEHSRIYDNVDINDSVFFAVYHSQKDGIVNSQYVVYIILDEAKKPKDIIFDVFCTGL